MKRKSNSEKNIYVCERCGNPISPYAIKCKWCKKTLRPECYESQDNKTVLENNDKKDGND